MYRGMGTIHYPGIHQPQHCLYSYITNDLYENLHSQLYCVITLTSCKITIRSQIQILSEILPTGYLLSHLYYKKRRKYLNMLHIENARDDKRVEKWRSLLV